MASCQAQRPATPAALLLAEATPCTRSPQPLLFSELWAQPREAWLPHTASLQRWQPAAHLAAVAEPPLLSLELEDPPTPKLHELEEARRKLDRDLRFGEAVRTLREDIPLFFDVRPLPACYCADLGAFGPDAAAVQVKRPQNYDVFCEDVTFIDDISPYLSLGPLRTSVHGKGQYRRRLNTLRAVMALLFRVDQVLLLALLVLLQQPFVSVG